jgi:hypothetical protein
MPISYKPYLIRRPDRRACQGVSSSPGRPEKLRHVLDVAFSELASALRSLPIEITNARPATLKRHAGHPAIDRGRSV